MSDYRGPYDHGAALVAGLSFWTKFVFQPMKILREQFPALNAQSQGADPDKASLGEGLGRHYCYDPGPHYREFLASETATVQGFDDMSESYEHLVHEFSDELWKAAEPTLTNLIPRNGRVLDPSAGPGREAIRLARWLTGGEVVAADLSRNMVERALHNAEAAGVENMAFHQLNAERLGDLLNAPEADSRTTNEALDSEKEPEQKERRFDAIVSSLAFHHYQRERLVARSFAEVLKPGGIAFVIDGGPEWFQKLARPISVTADPGFVRHHSGQDFTRIFESVKGRDGENAFERVSYTQILPGFYLVAAQKRSVPNPKPSGSPVPPANSSSAAPEPAPVRKTRPPRRVKRSR